MTSYTTDAPEQTSALGKALAKYIAYNRESKDIMPFVALYGDLGVGKTEFTRGFVSYLSPGSRVKSPTYTIVNEYLKGEAPVYHFDFYRIESSSELDGIGFEEYTSVGICIAEWCERLDENDLPDDSIKVCFTKLEDDSRIIQIYGVPKLDYST